MRAMRAFLWFFYTTFAAPFRRAAVKTSASFFPLLCPSLGSMFSFCIGVPHRSSLGLFTLLFLDTRMEFSFHTLGLSAATLSYLSVFLSTRNFLVSSRSFPTVSSVSSEAFFVCSFHCVISGQGKRRPADGYITPDWSRGEARVWWCCTLCFFLCLGCYAVTHQRNMLCCT